MAEAAITVTILERVARSARPGVLLRQLLQSLRRRRRRMARDERQMYLRLRLALPVIQLGPSQGPLLPWDHVQCKMGGHLSVAACLTMRSRVWPSGRRKGARVRLECIGCELGVGYRARCSGFVEPPPSQPAEVLSPAQRAARRGADLGRLLTQVECSQKSPLSEAAELTPTDWTDWKAGA